MRRELIEALDFPKKLILKLIGQRNCPHDNRFEEESERCQQCDVNGNCEWVRCLTEYADFDGRATQTINLNLLYGLNFVESVHGRSEHDEATCDCEACTWMRDAQELNDAFDMRFAANRYKHLY